MAKRPARISVRSARQFFAEVACALWRWSRKSRGAAFGQRLDQQVHERRTLLIDERANLRTPRADVIEAQTERKTARSGDRREIDAHAVPAKRRGSERRLRAGHFIDAVVEHDHRQIRRRMSRDRHGGIRGSSASNRRRCRRRSFGPAAPGRCPNRRRRLVPCWTARRGNPADGFPTPAIAAAPIVATTTSARRTACRAASASTSVILF